MIRVLHMVGSLEMGGSQTMVMSIYRMLDKTQIQFDFVVDTDEPGCFEKEIEACGGRIYKLPKFNGRNFKAVQRAWESFFREHPEYRILHSHVRSYASIYIPVAKKCGVKTIIHSHNTSNGKGLKALVKMIMQYPLRYQADYFFGCSEKAGHWLFGKRVTESDRFYILKNAVDLDRFAFDEEVREKVRRELDVDEDTLLLGHVGRFHVQKNHHFLIECFRAVVDVRPEAKLVLLGDGELRDEITQHIHDLGLDKQVILAGVKPDAERYLCAMDMMLLPSFHEGLPVVVVEAQASGLMSLAADTITDEVKLSDLVEYLPIHQGVTPWVEIIKDFNPVRRDVSSQIEESGFSVKSSAQWLYEFYRGILV